MQNLVLNTAKRCIVQAQAAQKFFYDNKHKSMESFAIGDKVFVSSHSFALVKTEPRWMGPYEVLKKLSEVDYEIDLPYDCGAHKVFHVSKLKKSISGNAMDQNIILPVLDTPKKIEVILSHRRGKGRGGPLFLTVKYEDKSLDAAEELTISEARILSPAIVDEFLQKLKQVKK